MKKYLLFAFLLYQNTLLSENINWQSIINYKDHRHNFVGISKADNDNIMTLIDIEGANLPGPQREILKSTNKGLNWNRVYLDSIISWNYAQNICYPTENYCIATCSNNYILKTTDGGIHWEEKLINLPKSTNGIVYISLLDSLYGVIGTYKDIAYSNDGFKTYKILTFPRKLMPTAIKIISPKKIYIVVANSASFLEYDAITDSSVEYPNSFPKYELPYNIPESIYFSDSLYGFVAGLRKANIGNSKFDMIHKTTDGGRTWVEVLNAYNNPQFGLTEIDFCDKENGIAVGQFGKIYWTHDSGNTWVQDSNKEILYNQAAVLHAVILNKNTALIADFTGKMWRTPIITDVPEINNENEAMQIVPNPASDYIEISNINPMLQHGDASIPEVRIYDIYGRNNPAPPLPTREGVRINVSFLPSGIYFVMMGDKVFKFIKL